MTYVTVPKDLTKIKSKMLFGLTKRQLVCFGSAALVGVPLFFLSKGSMGTTSADRKSTRLNSSHANESRMPSSA